MFLFIVLKGRDKHTQKGETEVAYLGSLPTCSQQPGLAQWAQEPL